ncbi:MAG: ribonuclease P protein component [Bacteroidales bacterium]|nr:ribonuclease P protein component [Bacteroidales bacterium]
MNERRILALLKTGQVAFRYPLKVHFAAVEGTGDFGVSVPKRLFKRAVKRNLLKRRVREAFRLNAVRLGERRYDIFIYYVGKEVADYERIDKSLAQILDDLAAR